jgi:hypothetical protein
MGKLYKNETDEKRESWHIVEVLYRKPKESIIGTGIVVIGLIAFFVVMFAMERYFNSVISGASRAEPIVDISLTVFMALAFAIALVGIWYLDKHDI